MKRYNVLIILALVLSLFSLPTLAEGFTLPSPTSEFYVYDEVNVLSPESKQLIVSSGARLSEKTGAQVVVVVVKSLQEQSIEEYANTLFRAWGIGDKTKNNGVLILVAPNDRKSRIEVGYGLEGILPDGKTGRIQDEYMVPRFKNGDFDTGIREGYLAVMQEISKEYKTDPISPPPTTEAKPSPASGIKDILEILFIIGVVVFIIFLNSLIFKYRGPRGPRGPGGLGGGGFGGGGFGGGGFGGRGGSSGGGGSSRGW